MNSAAEPIHTQAPWFAVYNGRFWDLQLENREYAQSFATVHKNDSLRISAEASAANARLIAAAPDMLDALRTLLEVHDAMGAGQSYAADKARMAIAKATEADLLRFTFAA